MLEDVRQFTDFLVKWKITPNQFFLCWLLFWDHKEYDKDRPPNPNDSLTYANLFRYTSKVKSWNKKEVTDLEKKGLIKNNNKGSNIKLSKLEISDKFINAVVVQRPMFKEFWDFYPTWIKNFDHPSKPEIGLKNAVYEDLQKVYMKLVKTKKRHKKVMEILKWCKRNDKIRMNIENFVRSKMWENYEELMEQQGEGAESQFGTKTAF